MSNISANHDQQVDKNHELYHYGVKGMRWRNKKGNRNRSSSASQKKLSSEERAKLSRERKRQELQKISKNRSLLTTQALKNKIERIKTEQELQKSIDNYLYPGKKIVVEILTESGKKAATNMVTGAIMYLGKAAATKSFDSKEFGEALYNGGKK